VDAPARLPRLANDAQNRFVCRCQLLELVKNSVAKVYNPRVVPAPKASALLLAVLITLVVVPRSVYWQPDTRTPIAVQAALVFIAAALTLGRFRRA
jgi:hypothetical protein